MHTVKKKPRFFCMELENDAVLTARHFDTFNLFNITILFYICNVNC